MQPLEYFDISFCKISSRLVRSPPPHRGFCVADEPGKRVHWFPMGLLVSERKWRGWEWRNAANGRGAGWQKWRRNQGIVPLGRSRSSGHANTCKGIHVRIWSCESVREGLEERNDLVLLRIRQAKLTDGHVLIVGNLGFGPAVHLLDGP